MSDIQSLAVNLPSANKSILFIDDSLEEDHKFVVLNIGNDRFKSNMDKRRSTNMDSLIHAAYLIDGFKRKKDIHGAIDILLKLKHNKYALALLAIAYFKVGQHQISYDYTLEALEAGCIDMLDHITILWLYEDNPRITFEPNKRCSIKSNFADNVRIFNKLDNKALEYWISSISQYYSRELYMLMLTLSIEKNNTIDQLKQQLQEQKNSHEAEIKELLAPGNLGAKAAESRFKASTSIAATDKTSADIKGLDE